jgi:hypothetical protein
LFPRGALAGLVLANKGADTRTLQRIQPCFSQRLNQRTSSRATADFFNLG